MSRTETAPFSPGVTDTDRARVYASMLVTLFLAALDQTIVATALPSMVEDLRAVDRYAWVATAYLLASTALALVYGKLADTYSRKRITLGAVVRFLTGSVLCGVAGMGGTLPLYLFTEVAGKPAIVVPVANHDNNQHAPDENLRIANLWYAIDLYAALMTMPIAWAS